MLVSPEQEWFSCLPYWFAFVFISKHSCFLKNYIMPSSVNLPLADLLLQTNLSQINTHFREDIFIMVTDFQIVIKTF